MTALIAIGGVAGAYAIVRNFELLAHRTARYEAIMRGAARVYTWAEIRLEAARWIEQRTKETQNG